MAYDVIEPPSNHIVEKSPWGHWQIHLVENRAERGRFITGGNGTSRYLLRMEDNAMIARTFRVVPVETTYGDRSIRIGRNFTLVDDDLREARNVIVVGNRVGYLSWFNGTVTYSGSTIDGGVIYKTYVSSQHRRKGVATAALHFARDLFPAMDIRHSDALSADGAAFAAATSTPNDLLRRRSMAA